MTEMKRKTIRKKDCSLNNGVKSLIKKETRKINKQEAQNFMIHNANVFETERLRERERGI